MKALILVAGIGTRLAPITNDRPKSLVPVNGTPILLKQIDNLHQNGITDITIISGYKAEILKESMKVVERDGQLVQISKVISPEDALGASIDVYKFSAEGGNTFFRKCAEFIEDKKELKLWSEVALNDILGEVVFKACPLVGRWLEIDNHEDLAAAEKLFDGTLELL